MYPEIDCKKTGQNLYLLMSERNLSVNSIQEYFGFTNPQAVYNWLHGKALPSVRHLYALSRLLGISIDDIIVGYDDDVVVLFFSNIFLRLLQYVKYQTIKVII